MATRPVSSEARNGPERGQGSSRRGEIVAAVQRLLGEWGSSDRLTMRAVAKEVGIAAPSIYLHFADKTELVWAALVDRYDELVARMAEAGKAVTLRTRGAGCAPWRTRTACSHWTIRATTG
ncbi:MULTISPECIES: TetR/AcrR family transcriptional regulator [unclassified Streptomyces]|uniref:TetR/AcrR family transcriptional regulator n=1 Tax=unclassified Streptomyces TaxID=2593676 RepID=UPI002E76358D|nr:TetR/AcrR family transcriptional regulator [Streptomyces sp. JV184]